MATPLGRLPVWRRQATFASRVQDVELASRRIDEVGAEQLIATPADDQERVTGAVGIDVHNVVGERLIETGRAPALPWRSARSGS